jgi:hypothetical protein
VENVEDTVDLVAVVLQDSMDLTLVKLLVGGAGHVELLLKGVVHEDIHCQVPSVVELEGHVVLVGHLDDALEHDHTHEFVGIPVVSAAIFEELDELSDDPWAQKTEERVEDNHDDYQNLLLPED